MCVLLATLPCDAAVASSVYVFGGVAGVSGRVCCCCGVLTHGVQHRSQAGETGARVCVYLGWEVSARWLCVLHSDVLTCLVAVSVAGCFAARTCTFLDLRARTRVCVCFAPVNSLGAWLGPNQPVRCSSGCWVTQQIKGKAAGNLLHFLMVPERYNPLSQLRAATHDLCKDVHPEIPDSVLW